MIKKIFVLILVVLSLVITEVNMINADENEFQAQFDAGCQYATEMLTDTLHDFSSGSTLAPYSAYYWKMNVQP